MKREKKVVRYLRFVIRFIGALVATPVLLRAWQQKRLGKVWEWAFEPIQEGRTDLDSGNITQLDLSD